MTLSGNGSSSLASVGLMPSEAEADSRLEMTAAEAADYDESHHSLEDYYAGEDNRSKVLFEFVLHGIFLNLIGVIGLIGNGISIAILSRPQMKSSTNLILCFLATFDTVVILTSMLMLSLPAVYRFSRDSLTTFYYEEVFPYTTPFVYALGMVAQTGSVYSTLCVTVERYIVICWPLRCADIITYGRTKIAIFSIFLLAILYNLPRFFEITWMPVSFDPVTNETTKVDVVTTALRGNDIYISVYITWMYLVFMYAVPFGGLSVLNLLIFLDVRRSNSRQATLSHHERKEHKLAIMLMVVVLAFFVCNVLAFIVNIMELFWFSYKPLTEISNFLVIVNSSCNIFIYTIFGEKFQRQLCLYSRRWLRKCCRKGSGGDDDLMLDYAKSFYQQTGMTQVSAAAERRNTIANHNNTRLITKTKGQEMMELTNNSSNAAARDPLLTPRSNVTTITPTGTTETSTGKPIQQESTLTTVNAISIATNGGSNIGQSV